MLRLVSGEREIEPLCLTRSRRRVAIQEDQAGVLGLQQLHLKYYSKRALKRLMNPEPYYRYPRVKSSYRTCDSLAD